MDGDFGLGFEGFGAGDYLFASGLEEALGGFLADSGGGRDGAGW